MGSVFANTNRVSGKKTPNKSAPAMMSVCLSPPSPPAGPIPIPYPVADMANHTADGTGSVYIEKKEVGKKNSSTYSTCSGNQPATRSFGADIVSHVIEGKTKFQAYSFNVMFEKGGADRFMDLTTSNHSNCASAVAMNAADKARAEAQAKACTALRAQASLMRLANEQASEQERERWGPTEITKRQQRERRASALTACQSGPSGAVQRRTSRALSAEACEQRGMPVEPKTGLGTQSSRVCGGGTPYNSMERKNHTEAQMLENIPDWTNLPEWVAFATDWPNRHADLRNGPCEDCQEKLDEACECGLNIVICDSDGNPRDYCE